MKNQFESPFFILRTPLLPYSNLSNFLEKHISLNSVLEQLNNTLIKEALYFGSKDLYTEFAVLSSADLQTIEKKSKKKLLQSLFLYYQRMSSRSTPFGLFAGISVGKWSNSIKLDLENNNIRRFLSLDTEYLAGLIRNLSQQPVVKENLIYFSNNTVFKKGKSWRYIEAEVIKMDSKYSNYEYKYRYSAIENNPINSLIIKKTEYGATFKSLLQTLTDFGFNELESKIYLEDLIANKVIINDVEPINSGLDYLETIVQKFEHITDPSLALIAEISSSINNFNTKKEDLGPDNIQYYNALLKKTKIFDTTHVSKNVFQMNMFREDPNEIPSKELEQVEESVKVLIHLNNNLESPKLEKFKKDFEEKYDARTVPLLELFDKESGLQFGQRPSFDLPGESPQIKWNDKTKYKFQLYKKHLSTNEQEIKICETPDDLFSKTIRLPDVMTMIGAIDKSHASNSKIRFTIRTIVTSSPLNILGRFCFNKDLLHLVKELAILEEKANPGVLMAEIVHQPSDRAGNITMRPHLRDFEIPVLTRSTLSKHKILRLSDLHVFMRSNQLILWSKKYNKEVRPKLSNAHNYNTSNLDIYRFLCSLQYQYEGGAISWDWEFLKDEQFLPRITYHGSVLSPMIWNIKFDQLYPVMKNSQEAMSIFKDKLASLNVPEEIILNIPEKEVVLNIKNDFCLEILFDELKKKGQIQLLENLFYKNNSLVKSTAGGYTNEIIIPLVKKNLVVNQGVQEPPVFVSKSIKRDFPPGSNWCYLNIYMNHGFADKFLLQLHKSFLKKVTLGKSLTKWFFIRYTDPYFHLRIRFYTDRSGHRKLYMNRIVSFLTKHLKNGTVTSFNFDTYVRELERYGSSNINLSEDLFFQSSELCIALIGFLNKNKNTDQNRFATCVIGVDFILDSFGLTLEEKYKLVNDSQIINSLTFKTRRTLTEKLFLKTSMEEIKRAISYKKELDVNNQNNETQKIFSQFKSSFSVICIKIKMTINGDETMLYKIILSHIHMFVNRLSNKDSKQFEILSFDNLAQIYSSTLKKEKVAKANILKNG